jgi:hypothetical protein
MTTAEELGVVADYEYQTKRVMLVPYTKVTRVHLPEDLLVRLYRITRDDQLLEISFPGMEMDLVKFVSFMAPLAVQILCVRSTEGVLVPAGYGYVIGSDGVDGARTARIGFVFLRQYHGTKEIRDLGMFLAAWWFDKLRVDVLYGTMLKRNHIGQNFARRRFGFRVLCELPKFFPVNGRLEDGCLVCLEKATFMPYYQQWKNTLELNCG